MPERLTREALDEILREEELPPQAFAWVERWLARGDGVAIYCNELLGDSQLGTRQIMSYGSPAAQLEVDEPPETLPDIGQRINWRFRLEATYRG